MNLKLLTEKVNGLKSKEIPDEAFEMVDEMTQKGFSEKDIKAKLKKQFPKISTNDLEILLKVA